MEQRESDLSWVRTLRSSRENAVESSSSGNLAEVLQAELSHPSRRTYVVKLLDVHPKLGKVAGRRLLQSLHISQFARVDQLTTDQISSILVACGEQA